MENIWEIAKNMEKEGMEFYLKLSKESQIDELAGLFHFLSQQEKDHYDTFDKLSKLMNYRIWEKRNTLDIAKDVFKKIADIRICQ